MKFQLSLEYQTIRFFDKWCPFQETVIGLHSPLLTCFINHFPVFMNFWFTWIVASYIRTVCIYVEGLSRKTKTSRLSSLSPSPSKIRQSLPPTEDEDITTKLIDDHVTIHESVTPVVTILIPVSSVPVMKTVVVTLLVSLTPLLPGIIDQSLTALLVSTSDNNRQENITTILSLAVSKPYIREYARGPSHELKTLHTDWCSSVSCR